MRMSHGATSWKLAGPWWCWMALLATAGCSDSMSTAEKESREALRAMGAITVLGVDQIHVGTLTLTAPDAKDKMHDAIPHVANMPYLTHLDVANTNLTDEHMSTIGGLKRLISVVLSDTQITDSGLKQISRLPIDTIYVDGTKITGASMDVLGKIKSIKILDISRTNTTSNLQPLSKLTNLEWLVLEDTKIDAAIVDILKDLPALGRLSISRSTISEAELARLKSAKPALKIDRESAVEAVPEPVDEQTIAP